MGPRAVPPLPEGCPWSGFSRPDLKHCEENLCSWITAPANTWSNVAFIAAGAWLWSRRPPRAGSHSSWFGPAAVIVGATSFLFHASYTWLFQAADYLGMFLWAWLLLTIDLSRARRRGDSGPPASAAFLAAGVAASAAALALFRRRGWPVQLLMGALVLALGACEAGLWLRDHPRRGGALGGTVLLLGAGFAFWMLDYHRVLCDPHDHVVQGHAIWHLFAAASFLTAERFYAQFE